MSNIPKSPFIIVDGSSYLFRAYHALPPLVAPNGQPTGAIYGVVNMLKKLQTDYQPQQMVVVFDSKGKNFRHDLFPAYKANREAMPEELEQQLAPLFEVIEAMGLPILQVPNIEADDLIGTLAKQVQQAKKFCLISTIDKDLAQLVDPKTFLINTMTNKILDPLGVEAKFGVRADQIIDYLALMGDSSDNIPGVSKVGPKTAAKWLTEYGTLENLLKHESAIKGKVGETLRQSHDVLHLSKQLTTIKQDLPLKQSITDLTIQPVQTGKLKALFKQFAFKRWYQALEGKPSEEPLPKAKRQYDLILNQTQLDHLIQKIQQKKCFAFDTETTSLDPLIAQWVGLAIAIEPSRGIYIPIGHDYEGAPEQLSLEQIIKAFKPLFEDQTIVKIAHHLKYDLAILKRYDLHLAGTLFDTMLESYLVNSTATRHNLDALALKYLQHENMTFEEVAGKGAKQRSFNEIEVAVAAEYAAEDAQVTFQLHYQFWSNLLENKKQALVFSNIEMPLVHVLARMEHFGVLLDAEKLQAQSLVLEKALVQLEKKAHQLAQADFNLNSPKQLQEILFEKMGLPILSKTPTGQPSTSEAVLTELAYEFELASIVLEYRSLNKLKSTYTDKLPQQIHSQTGRVHTAYHQAVTSTGRLSSSDPNLQNIPIRTAQGRQIRQAFIAPSGFQILSADYSQIELRLMAHLSEDRGLLEAFKQGEDIHKTTAAQIFDCALEQVDQEQRRHAKAINFGLMYGMSAFGLAKQLERSQSEAQAYIDLYFKRFPGVQDYMVRTKEGAQKNGFVETIQGRRLYLPDLKSSNVARKRAAERAAINAPLQGSAADLIKIAMIQIDQWIQADNIQAKMIMQVHDELVFEVATDQATAIGESIRQWMCQAQPLSVALEVAVGVGANWDLAHA